MVVFLGVGSVLGRSLEQSEIKRELETSLVWIVTKSTSKIHGVLCEMRWWPPSVLDKRNQIPCLLLQNGPDWLFPFLSLVCPVHLEVFLLWLCIRSLEHNTNLMSWLTCCLVVKKDQWVSIKLSIENNPAVEQGWFPFSLNWNIGCVC